MAQLAARCVWDAEVPGSSPGSPTDMDLKEKIQKDIISALKEGNKPKLEVLRYLSAQIKDKEIEQQRKQITDEELVKLISNLIKKVEENLSLYEKNQRQDLIEKAKTEIGVLRTYLPAQMSSKDLEKEIDKIIVQNPNLSNPGQLIGIAVKLLSGKADNKRIAAMVGKRLVNK